MLFLLMQLDGARYALDILQVAEVLPLVQLRPVPRAPLGVAGMIDYGGVPVPVVDLTQLLAGRAAERRLSTRLVIVRYETGGRGELLGLVAERATETMRRDPGDFRDSGLRPDTPPRLGPVVLDAAGPVHRIDVRDLLSTELAGALFPAAVNA
jgi:chemotaxis-related protein WspB